MRRPMPETGNLGTPLSLRDVEYLMTATRDTHGRGALRASPLHRLMESEFRSRSREFLARGGYLSESVERGYIVTPVLPGQTVRAAQMADAMYRFSLMVAHEAGMSRENMLWETTTDIQTSSSSSASAAVAAEAEEEQEAEVEPAPAGVRVADYDVLPSMRNPPIAEEAEAEGQEVEPERGATIPEFIQSYLSSTFQGALHTALSRIQQIQHLTNVSFDQLILSTRTAPHFATLVGLCVLQPRLMNPPVYVDVASKMDLERRMRAILFWFETRVVPGSGGILEEVSQDTPMRSQSGSGVWTPGQGMVSSTPTFTPFQLNAFIQRLRY